MYKHANGCLITHVFARESIYTGTRTYVIHFRLQGFINQEFIKLLVLNVVYIPGENSMETNLFFVLIPKTVHKYKNKGILKIK